MIQGTNLKTNALIQPDSLTPGRIRFSWIPIGAREQTAFRVMIKEEETIVYDSGKIVSTAFSHVPEYRAKGASWMEWHLTLWDEKGFAGTESISCFQTVPGQSDWQAKWIDPEEKRPWLEIIPVPGEENNPNPAARIRKEEHRNPASYLKKQFYLEESLLEHCLEKEGQYIRLYATAHGIYDIWLNGVHLDGWLLAPGTSQYNKRLMVQGYDVSGLLRAGENTILVSLGDGWYRGSVGNNMDINTFGDDVAFLCQMMAGGEILLTTDETWMACHEGPLAANDMMRGEVYDANREEIFDKDQNLFPGKEGAEQQESRGSVRWYPVTIQDYGYGNLIGSDCQPISPAEQFLPRMITTPAGETVLDFGQNFAGYVKLHLVAEGGEQIVMTHGETLDENGNFTTANFQNPQKPECYQRIIYTCKPGENRYQPRKCYFGFRYVKLETELAVTGQEFTGVAIYSRMQTTCRFSCGNEEVNQLFRNTLWSMKSNFVGVPTDCPTREKSGFTGDAQVFCSTALYLMDSYPVFRQWLRELAETELPDGGLRQVAPDNRAPGYFEKSAGWCDAMEIIPWRLWKQCNTLEAAEEEYEAMKRWLAFSIDRGKETRPENRERVEKELLPYFVDMGFHWGEWLEPGSDSRKTTMEHMMHGEPEVATAYLSYGCRLMAEMADALGKKADAEYYSQVSELAKRAYRQAFLPEENVESERQCRYVRPLALGLLEEGEQERAAKALAENVMANDNHLNTGFLSTGELCRVLTDYGQTRTAYDLLLQTECPGWLYPVRKGATTIWERWEGIAPDGKVKDSLNHYSYGAVAGWLIDRVCGIQVEQGNIRIRPCPDRRLGYARAEYLSVAGNIVCGWQYRNDRLHVEVDIPCGCRAEIILPDGTRENRDCGHWQYCVAVS